MLVLVNSVFYISAVYTNTLNFFCWPLIEHQQQSSGQGYVKYENNYNSISWRHSFNFL